MAILVDPADRLAAVGRLASLDADSLAELLKGAADVILDGTLAAQVRIEVQGLGATVVERRSKRAPGDAVLRRVLRAQGETLGDVEVTAAAGTVFARADEVLVETATRLVAEVVARRRLAEGLALEHETVRTERARLDTLLRVLPVGVFVVDADGWLVQTNDAAKSLWGETPLVGPEEYERYRGWRLDGRSLSPLDYCISRARMERRTVVLDADIETFRGERRRVRNLAAPVLDAFGRLLGAVSINVDLSDHAVQEREREKAVELMEVVLRHLPAGLILAEADTGLIVIANESGVLEAWPLIPGTSTIDDLRVRTVETPEGVVVPFDEWPLIRALRHGDVIRGRPMVTRLPDGSRREFSVDAEPVRDPDGKVQSAIVVYADVTDAQRAARRARLLADASRALVETLDVQAVLQGLADRVVPGVADVCTVALVDRTGRLSRVALAHIALDADASSKLEAYLRHPILADRVVETGRPLCWPAQGLYDVPADYEIELLKESGLSEVLAVPMRVHGKTLGALKLKMINSGRHFEPADLELALELATRLGLAVANARLHEQANAAIAGRDLLIGATGHDLRSPLTVIRLQTDMLRRRLASPAPDLDRCRAAVDSIDANAGRTLRLLEGLLDVVRMQSGRKLPLDLAPVDLAEVAREVVEALAPTLEAAECKTDLTLDTPAVGNWDRLRLEQVVSNLVGNAAKYAPGKPIRIAVTADGAVARLVVADEGVGIAAEDLPSLFGPFARFGDATQTSGHGLGLWIAQQIVEALGGRIDVQSTVGQGTTFIVELPLAGPCDTTARPSAGP